MRGKACGQGYAECLHARLRKFPQPLECRHPRFSAPSLHADQASAADNPYFRKGDYSADRERASLFARFTRDIQDNGLDADIITRKGWFGKTLRKWPPGQRFAFAHVDADLHASVLVCLKAIYPRLSEGGILAVDDFFHHAQGPARAVSEYFSSIHRKPVLNVAFPYAVAIVKGEEASLDAHRSIDGHRYSLRLLREDKLLRRAVEGSAAKAERAGKDAAARQARRLLGLLQAGSPDTSADIYQYWSAMQAFWDDMDHDSPSARMPVKL
jgi:O-methyltransferase